MNRLFTLLLIACSAIACNQTLHDCYDIEGDIKGVEDGAVFSLFRIDGKAGMEIDQDTLTNGRFSFRIKPEDATKEHMTILCWQDDFPMMSLHLWAEVGERVRITGNDKLIYTWRVKGSTPENRSWQSYVRCAEELYNNLQQVMLEENALRARGMEPNVDQALLQEKYDSLGRLQHEIMINIHGRLIERMKSTKMDIVGICLLEEIASMCKYMKDSYPHRDAARQLYNALGEEWRNHPTVEQIGLWLYPTKMASKGEMMIDGEMFDLEGNSHTLSELQGKHILVDFWGCGCGPCIMAIPEMGEIANKYKDVLEVVSISTDSEKMWREASTKHDITWHNWSDCKQGRGIYAHYDQSGIPHYILISPEGIILDQWLGYGQGSLQVKIGQYLK